MANIAPTWRNIILDPIELAEIYEWIDSIPLSRPKGQIEKDFADGVLVAEIVKHYFPQIVDLRNYTHAKNLQERMSNWRLLNGKVFSRLGLSVPEPVMTQLSIAKPSIIEIFLYNLRESVRSMMLYRDMDPRLGTIRTLYSTNDPYMYKYNMLAPQDPLFKYANMDYHWRRKQLQQDQVRKTLNPLNPLAPIASLRGVDDAPLTNRNKKNGLKSKTPAGLPPISQALLLDRNNGAVSKLEIEEKNQEILAKDEEIQTLKAKLKRLEHLITLKDTRIEDLQTQVQKLRPGRRIAATGNNNN